MNKVILLGRLVRDPQIRYSQSNEPVCIASYTLAVNKKYKKQGEPDADFIDCTAFSKSAEFAEKYFKKGMLICVSGRLQIEAWEDKQTGQKRTAPVVIIEDQDFAESKATFEARNSNNDGNNGVVDEVTPGNDDLPF